MPQWVLEAGLDLDVVSFSYPSRPWERAAIPQAADDLKSWLDTELQAYRHLVFVTHSSGGLVVKDMLRGAARDGHVAVPGSAPGAPRSVGLRTRRTSPCRIRAGLSLPRAACRMLWVTIRSCIRCSCH
ncbi:MAG: hypothetical protein M3461_21440 [Pseudomonadota bacterium]|nr:hypothetical protein [Pseudomonadota bacterium]